MTESKRRPATTTPASKKTQKVQTSKRRGRLSEADREWVVPKALKRGSAEPRGFEEGGEGR